MKNPPAIPVESPPATPLESHESADSEPACRSGKGETLLRLVVPGDPLEVRSHVARRLRDRCLLLDPHGVSVQVLANIAVDRRNMGLMEQSGGIQALDLGIKQLVERTVENVIDDCVAGRLEVPVVGLARGGVLAQLCSVLKLSHTELVRACDRFNALPAEARRAFHALILQRRSLESACRRSASAAESWSQGAASGLAAILGACGKARGQSCGVEVSPAGDGSLTGGGGA